MGRMTPADSSARSFLPTASAMKLSRVQPGTVKGVMMTVPALTVSIDILALELTRSCNLYCVALLCGERAARRSRFDDGEGLADGDRPGRRAWRDDDPAHRRRARHEPRLPGAAHVRRGRGPAGRGLLESHACHPGPVGPVLHAGVRLAVSYYSDEPAGHDAITKVPGSHARTRANILRALERGIPLRTATVEILPGQRAAQARDEMAGLGVARSRIDRVRRIGRGNHAGGTPDAGELCGLCGDGRAAIGPDGEVMPCVMSRWLAAGNIRRQPLDSILASAAWQEALTQIPPRPATAACGPDSDGETDTCGPEIGCKPS